MTKKFAAPLFILAAAIALPACGPSPDAVCDHTIELIKKELGDEAGEFIKKDECVEEMNRHKEMKGAIKWKEEAGCVMKAESMEDLEKCD